MIQIISAAIAVAAATIALVQLRTMRRLAAAERLHQVTRDYMSRESRDARGELYNLAGKPFDTWTDAEFLLAERVAGQLAELGLVVRHGYVSLKEFASWSNGAISRAYAAAKPLVDNRRRIANEPEAYVYFEWLARMEILERRRKMWHFGRRWLRIVKNTEVELEQRRNAIRSTVRPQEIHVENARTQKSTTRHVNDP